MTTTPSTKPDLSTDDQVYLALRFVSLKQALKVASGTFQAVRPEESVPRSSPSEPTMKVPS